VPRQRIADNGLPDRVYFNHGAYFYAPKGSTKWINLGRARIPALKEHERILAEQGARSVRPGAKISAYMDKYAVEHFPKLAAATQRTRRLNLANLREIFGDMYPDDVTAVDIYAYKELRRASPGQANGEIGALSHLYTKMIEWGGATKNPCFRIVKFQKGERERVPSIQELNAFCALAKNPIVPLYIQIKLAWGLRKKDILDLPRIPLSADYFDIEISKSKRWRDKEQARKGQVRRLVITPRIWDLISAVYALPGRPNICQHLFSPARGRNRGKRYSESGFDSVLETVHEAFEKAGGRPFNEHDIRASTATLDPLNAKKRLGHKHQSTTDKYLRQFDIERIEPLDIALTVPLKRPAK
jgi:integrase